MTTLDPGARVVFTQGLRVRPRSTAFFATSAAAIITEGLDVFVHEVIAAITTAPWSSTTDVPSPSVTGVGVEVRPCAPFAAECCAPAAGPGPSVSAAAEGTVASSLKLGTSEAGNDSSSASSCASWTDEVYAPSACRNIG